MSSEIPKIRPNHTYVHHSLSVENPNCSSPQKNNNEGVVLHTDAAHTNPSDTQSVIYYNAGGQSNKYLPQRTPDDVSLVCSGLNVDGLGENKVAQFIELIKSDVKNPVEFTERLSNIYFGEEKDYTIEIERELKTWVSTISTQNEKLEIDDLGIVTKLTNVGNYGYEE